MHIFIARPDQTHGPYTLEEVNTHMATGHLHASEQAWVKGYPAWVPLHQIPGVQLPTATVPPVSRAVLPPPSPFSAPGAAPPFGSHRTTPPVFLPAPAMPPSSFPTHGLPLSASQPPLSPGYAPGSHTHAPPLQGHPRLQNHALPQGGAPVVTFPPLNAGERIVFEITPTILPDLVLSLATAGAWLPLLIIRWMIQQKCKYRLTTERLLVLRGLAAPHVEAIELYRVQEVSVEQGRLGQRLGVGTVTVRMTDTALPCFSLYGVLNPLAIKAQLEAAARSGL